MTAYTAAHWGIYEVESGGADGPVLLPFRDDPDPSPIGLAALDACRSANRVQRPAVRKSWADKGWGANPELRGIDPYVEISWDDAIDLAATALKTTIAEHGNASIYGSSMGWSSAGRFHHAQSQVHRFLNTLGGYVRHADSYSLGAGRVLMPHLVAGMDELMATHTSWDVLAKHTQLFVSFGGVGRKNGQISQGLAGRHAVSGGLQAMVRGGARLVNISPVKADLDAGDASEWIAIRPGTDTAMLLALAHVLYTEDLHDRKFLATHCVGFEKFAAYLKGDTDSVPKTPEWAEQITSVPAQRIRTLAREMAALRTMATITWSLQRAHHGEQPFWALLSLACMLGQIGLPGGGFGVGYGAANSIGLASPRFGGPTLPQGTNAVSDFIPVARITDMLENPGAPFRYNGRTLRYPDISMIYWAGGNPFHHHQDLNRFLRAWRKPRSVIVHEQFWTPTAKSADLVLPATTTMERDDIGYGSSEHYMVAMRSVIAPVGQARDDYDIFADICDRFGKREAFTEGRDSHAWMRHLYGESAQRARAQGIAVPEFDAFWSEGLVDLAPTPRSQVMFEQFRADPVAHPLKTPSGRIEIFSETIAGFGDADCRGHATWYEPAEWLGSPQAALYPLHMLSDQPSTKLHSQLDHSALSRASKISGREPIVLNDSDARARGIAAGDVVRVFNGRGSCLAGAVLSDGIRAGVVKLSTGAWFDPADWDGGSPLEKHGNPNALTMDIGASALSQGCSAQTCLVQVEKFAGALPALTAFELPDLQKDSNA